MRLKTYTDEDLARATVRQMRHRAAKTDGESPYYDAQNDWCADLWARDIDVIVAAHIARWNELAGECWTDSQGGCDDEGNAV